MSSDSEYENIPPQGDPIDVPEAPAPMSDAAREARLMRGRVAMRDLARAFGRAALAANPGLDRYDH